MKIHDEIDNYLAADLHGELSDEEQNALHVHLVECASCRQAYQESKIMNKVLEETLAPEKADPTFEQRMLSAFRSKVPRRSSIGVFLVNVMRLRAAQITAAAAMLLALVQVGRMVTGERGAGSRNRAYFATNKVVAQPAQAPPTFFDTLDASHKSDDRRNKENDRLAGGVPQPQHQHPEQGQPGAQPQHHQREPVRRRQPRLQ